MPAPDVTEAIEIAYTVRYDVSADGFCPMTGFCDCEVVYRGGGQASPAKRPPGQPQTYVGTWAKASGTCHEAFELWVPPDGKAHHSLTIGADGALTEWVAHRDADPTRKTVDIKAGGQVWLSALHAPFVDGLARHSEDAAGDLGGIGLASHHSIEVRRLQGPTAKAPAGRTTGAYQATYTFAGEAPETCAARGTCPCEIRGEFQGEPLVSAEPATTQTWKGTWTPGPSTCKAGFLGLWDIPAGEAVLVVEPAGGAIATASLIPWRGTGIETDHRPQQALHLTSEPPSPLAKGAATLGDVQSLQMMLQVGPGDFAGVSIERRQTLTLRGLGP